MPKNPFFIAALVCAIATSAAAQKAKPATQIRVEAAIRFSALEGFDGREHSCAFSEPADRSCLAVKVSGIEPKRLQNIWMDGTAGGVHIVAGDKKIAVSSVSTVFGNNKYAVLEVAVPKAMKQFTLLAGDNPPVQFEAALAAVKLVKLGDLIEDAKKK